MSEQLQRALRQNQARRIRDVWAAALEQACGLPIRDRFLPVDNTASLRERFFEHVKRRDGSVRRSFIPKASVAAVSEVLDAAHVATPADEIVLLSSVDALLGGVRLPASAVLTNAAAVWKVVEQDLCMTTSDCSSGLCVEESVYDENDAYVGTGIYEVTAWGAFLGNS